MNVPYRATLVSKGNTLESPYNGNGLVDVTKVGEDRSYLMKPRFVIFSNEIEDNFVRTKLFSISFAILFISSNYFESIYESHFSIILITDYIYRLGFSNMNSEHSEKIVKS